MGLSIKGYVLEPPRVGSSDSAFTYTPNNFISNQGAFDAAYPQDESAPRTEYHLFVLKDFISPGTGPGVTRSFVDTSYAWTKNEVLQRFDYEGRDGRFKTLPGAPLTVEGTLASTSNTNRIQVPAPASTNLTLYPIRVSVGVGSGTTFAVTLVTNDGAFSTPSVGTVQLSRTTGNLNWNSADLTSFAGQTVRFQRQTFYTFRESTGNIGLITDILLLNPMPASGQFPLIRIGFSEYLTPVQRANEAAFSADPTAGTVEWALTTGRLKFNSGTIAANTGKSVYYDGTTFVFGVGLKVTTLGTVNSPGTLSPIPPEESDLFFRVANVVQFAQTEFVDTLSAPGKKGIVQVRRSTGQVQFSDADKLLYGAQTAQAVVPDIDIERGITLRMFRTPVNLADTDPTIKDVSALYASTGALLADPIVASPSVSLPAVPLDTLTINVEVTQGTGTFVGVLPRLDVSGPPVGLGCVINFETRELFFAQRKSNVVLTAPVPYGAVQLPDPLVFSSNLVLEIETSPNSGVYAPITVGEDALVDLASGLVTMVSTEGEILVNGTVGSFSGTTLTDVSQNFSGAGVVAGDYLIVTDGAAEGVYTIVAVGTTTLTTDVPGVTASNFGYVIRHGVEVLADRFFYDVPPVDPNTKVERIKALGTITNSPRFTVDPIQATSSRFRFGKTSFSATTVMVANDAAFTVPSSLPQGTVQVAQDTGHVNFSQADVTAGGVAYWSRLLQLGTDYTLQPPLGFVQFVERMLEKEEAFVTYKNANGDLVEERATFLVRKELTQPHPTPTDVLFFNDLGREVASSPTPRAFRGGRPQSSTQVQFDVGASSVAFIGQPTATDALPSGPTVGPNENVYIDYSIYEAIGGEQNFTVLQAPMQGVTITINEGESSFKIAGDRTTTFTADLLLLVNRAEAYALAASTYDSGDDLTTVNLALGQVFRSDQRNPTLTLTSGKIRVSTSPSYFVTELTPYDAIPRGMSKFRLQGDVSRTYETGVVVLFTDGSTYTDLNVVSGSSYNKDTDKTEVTLLGNSVRQYEGATLRRSVRAILDTAAAASTTALSPELSQPYTVFRRIEGQVGEILSQPEQYTIDASGRVVLVEPLAFNEEVGIFYTGDQLIEAGRRFRTSYTFAIAPSEDNGLLNQVLEIDYTTYIPDTFFWRVESFTNFRSELAEKYEEAAKASVPTGGPTLGNPSNPRLYEQGKESIFFEEGHLANEDLVARPTLKYFNDGINYLEDALQSMDGRYVGDQDGRFLFDGNIDNPPRASFDDVTNQIDDRFKISPAPYSVTGPPFVATSIGTYQEVYKASPTSRFYPTRRVSFNVATAGTEVGDPLLDTGVTNLRSVEVVQTRLPWCITTAPAAAGSTVFSVDSVAGSVDLLRPPLTNGMTVAIIAQDGTVLVTDGSPATITTASGTSITFSAPVAVAVPIGSTIRLSTSDSNYNQYQIDLDVGADLELGLLTYIDVGGTPPAAGEVLDATVSYNNTTTSPYRFPALDGGTTDDDGNRGFPILNPWTQSETAASGYLTDELRLINASTGVIRAVTTPPYVSTGSLDGTGTIVTNLAGAWPSPIPEIWDLIEIRTGPNGPSTFRRITAVGGSTVTVDTAFPVPSDTGFTFSVTVSTTLVPSSTTTTGSTSSIVIDTGADFVTAGVCPGHTVVLLSGPSTGSRRQVLTVTSATQLTVSPAFPSTTLSQTYRIDNPLQTFGGTASSLMEAGLKADLAGEVAALSTGTMPVIGAIDNFFNTAFLDVATGSNGVTSTSTFTSAGSTFQTNGVSTSHLLFIRSGSQAGVYAIASVPSQTSITIVGTFPSNVSGVTYRIVSTIGLSKDPLNDVLDAALNAETFLTSTQAFQSIVATQVSVAGDANAYAIRLRTSDLNSRETSVNSRISQVSTDLVGVEAELSAGDRLYDKRYVWIDARINLENGILVAKERAEQSRIDAQAEVLKQLTRLLSVR